MGMPHSLQRPQPLRRRKLRTLLTVLGIALVIARR